MLILAVAWYVQASYPILLTALCSMILWTIQRSIRRADEDRGTQRETMEKIGESVGEIKSDVRVLAERFHLFGQQNERDHNHVIQRLNNTDKQVDKAVELASANAGKLEAMQANQEALIAGRVNQDALAAERAKRAGQAI